MPRAFPSVVIENLQPLIDGGRYPIKRIVGEDLVVEADIFKDGHDVVSALLKWRRKGHARWHETPMTCIDTMIAAASASEKKVSIHWVRMPYARAVSSSNVVNKSCR